MFSSAVYFLVFSALHVLDYVFPGSCDGGHLNISVQYCLFWVTTLFVVPGTFEFFTHIRISRTHVVFQFSHQDSLQLFR